MNNTLNGEFRALKREHEIQVVRLYEVTKHKKNNEGGKEKVEDDNAMNVEDKRQMNTRLDERINDV